MAWQTLAISCLASLILQQKSLLVDHQMPTWSLTARPWKVTGPQKETLSLQLENHHFSGATMFKLQICLICKFLGDFSYHTNLQFGGREVSASLGHPGDMGITQNSAAIMNHSNSYTFDIAYHLPFLLTVKPLSVIWMRAIHHSV